MINKCFLAMGCVFGLVSWVNGYGGDCSNFIDYGTYQHKSNIYPGNMTFGTISDCNKGTCFSGGWRIDAMAFGKSESMDGWYKGSSFLMRRHLDDNKIQLFKGVCGDSEIYGIISDSHSSGDKGSFRIWK